MTKERQEGQPHLATTAGRYCEYAVPAALAPHLRCLWTHETAGAQPMAVVPDGYCDLICIDDRLMVVGPDRIAAFPEIGPGAEIVGARFAPGAAATWLGLPLSEIVGRTLPLRDIRRSAAANDLEARLAGCQDMPARLALLAGGLAKLMPDDGRPPADIGLVFAAADRKGPGRPVADLLAKLDIGERQLRRRCHHHFGYGIKTLERIRRFQRFLHLCRNGTAPLATLALEAGFADQAHMTREVVELTTLTPAAIAGQMRA
ncbi:helix-turn-helix domain-containing protein [Rhizobium binxianense]